MMRDVTDAPVEAAFSSSFSSSSSTEPDAELVDERLTDERLTTDEARRLIGVTTERMRALAGDGRVPATMVSHKWLFSRNDLLRMMEECPQVLYARRAPAVVEVTRARRERSRAVMLRLNATRDRHEAGMRGYLAFLAKLANEADPNHILPEEERMRRAMLLHRAHLARARAKKQAARNPATREEMIAQAEQRARNQAEREHSGAHERDADDGQKPLSICFQCWREDIGGRPPAKLVNVLCEKHQREHDEFATALRGEAS